MKKIQLTQGQVALVDDEDYEYLSQWKWCARKQNNSIGNFYAVRTQFNPHKTVLMHREINKTSENMVCDHINHNTLDNQKHNLRNVTYSQNNLNRRANNVLNEKCISMSNGSYEVRVRRDGNMPFRAWFTDLNSARQARDAAILRIHGEFGCTETLGEDYANAR